MFKDTVAARRILHSKDPGFIKSIGKRIQDVDEDTWQKEEKTVLNKLLLAKFTQCTIPRVYLMNTAEKSIAEASRDRIYGIGMDINHESVLDPSTWAKDSNLQGRTLMNVREELRSKNK